MPILQHSQDQTLRKAIINTQGIKGKHFAGILCSRGIPLHYNTEKAGEK
jgi:hypothetical protein